MNGLLLVPDLAAPSYSDVTWPCSLSEAGGFSGQGAPNQLSEGKHIRVYSAAAHRLPRPLDQNLRSQFQRCERCGRLRWRHWRTRRGLKLLSPALNLTCTGFETNLVLANVPVLAQVHAYDGP